MTEIIPDKLKLPFNFDSEKLKADLSKVKEEEWIEHFNTGGYEGNWKITPLRSPSDADHPILSIVNNPTNKEFVNTELYSRCPYIAEVMSNFECPLRTVRLMKLAAGSVIKPHRDFDLNFEKGEVRIHVPIITNNQVKFFLNGKRVKMKEGECWYLRLSDVHTIANLSNIDRTHLVLDCEVNKWFEEIFLEAKESNKGILSKLFNKN